MSVVDKAAVKSGPEGFVRIAGEHYYRIPAFDRMDPFLMSLTSDSDLWMYVSSVGALAAGRGSEDGSLFLYQTDDKIHQAQGITGPVTLVRITAASGSPFLWEPFARIKTPGAVRSLYKTALGNRIIFEETMPEYGLTFRYRWANCDEFGFVRSSWLELADGADAANIEVLDGVLDLIPAGLELACMQSYSCLGNAYSQHELDCESQVGIFAMSSKMVDRAEPAEVMCANIAWTCGLAEPVVTLSTKTVARFREGEAIEEMSLCTGRRGAYLVNAAMRLSPGRSSTWHIVLDAARDQRRIVELRGHILSHEDMTPRLERALAEADRNLKRLVASADGIQLGEDETTTAHHAANVMFNIMRGGIFRDGYEIMREDFAAFVGQRNRPVAKSAQTVLRELPAKSSCQQLLTWAATQQNADLQRLALEYLPLTFSRRHGDPSRPWNRFAIRVKNPDGSPAIAYQGNWRDIYQNWEALCYSYPEFIEPIIAKFVNASTLDGFNPYRITHEGIDWEIPEPHNPWSNIGYWGDHQIIYLLKMLEASHRFHPGRLEQMLEQPIFSYADVPYRLKRYDEMLKDPHNTIEFDWEAHRKSGECAAKIGADGKLLHAADGSIVHVTLLEKLLVPTLSKLSSLVFDGGIWMNTQRPEWNDANNALVGHGVSMVTLCYLRRHVAFLMKLLAKTSGATPVSGAVVAWLTNVVDSLKRHKGELAAARSSDESRKQLLDELGNAFDRYRSKVYSEGLGDRCLLKYDTVRDLLSVAMRYLDHAIRACKRDDGLYDAYNLLEVSRDGKRAIAHRMYPMLEGQVAVLGSGALSAGETIEVLRSLYASEIYREDQQSFMLYPARRLPRFLQKNQVPAESVEGNALLKALLAAGDETIVLRDVEGKYRFAAGHANGAKLAAALDALGRRPECSALLKQYRQEVVDLYEQVFKHRSFTGRSGTMYGYEGIGCIYWHMVAKLLLAVQECCTAALRQGASESQVRELQAFYRRVRSGLGFHKTAAHYGAFPVDPYSHSPAHAGAQQPGMTGQVKEEILTRWGELGVCVQGGQIHFRPTLLDRREILRSASEMAYVGPDGKWHTQEIAAGEIAFTFCQTPVLYRAGPRPVIRVTGRDGSKTEVTGNVLGPDDSNAIMRRTGEVALVEVVLPGLK